MTALFIPPKNVPSYIKVPFFISILVTTLDSTFLSSCLKHNIIEKKNKAADIVHCLISAMAQSGPEMIFTRTHRSGQRQSAGGEYLRSAMLLSYILNFIN